MDTPKEKLCHRCGRVLPIDDFARNKCTRDGRQTYCKDCTSEINRTIYRRNHPQRKEARIRWIDRPIDEQKAHAREMRARRMEIIYSNPRRLAEYRLRRARSAREYYRRRREAAEAANNATLCERS